MFNLNHLRIFFYLFVSIAGLIITLVIAVSWIKEHSLYIFLFFCFYLISILHLSSVFVLDYLKTNIDFPLSLQQFWKISLSLSRIRFVFLIFFVHSLYRHRFTLVLNIFMPLLVVTGAIIPFYIYSTIPEIIELLIILYLYIYWFFLFIYRSRLPLPPAIQNLINNIFFCSSFFLIGIIMDILEDLPHIGIYFSMLLIDFYPFYIICLGVVFSVHIIKNIFGSVSMGNTDLILKKTPGPEYHELTKKHHITNREGEIINLIVRGETNSSIARKLYISESTVKKHINNIFRKLGIKNRWELLRLM